MRTPLRLVLLGAVLAALASAQIRLAPMFRDHAVLQRGMPLPIWGDAPAGAMLRVQLGTSHTQVRTGADGRWRAVLPARPAGGPWTLTVSGEGDSTTATDILIGEVWLCSGQSNMELPLPLANHGAEEVAAANDPEMRLLRVPHRVADQPQHDFDAAWAAVTPEAVSTFSAVGYFFGRELRGALHVPVGLIESDWGGTPAEAWTPYPVLTSRASLHPVLTKWKQDLAAFAANPDNPKYKQEPWNQTWPGGSWTPAGLYNGMIAPLAPAALRGVIWYQGESNADRAFQYRTLFPAMITGWRQAWGRPVPFLFVQLPNFGAAVPQPGESPWAELREAQLMTLRLPSTGMAIAIDLGEAKNIHPKNKQEVGHRLALAALARAYRRGGTASGPLYVGMRRLPRGIRVRFAHVGPGLVAEGDAPLRGFAVAGADHKFVWAQARIVGDAVVVSAAEVPHPVAVRYDWADNPDGNLFSRDGLPASPFRTDAWPGMTVKAGK